MELRSLFLFSSALFLSMPMWFAPLHTHSHTKHTHSHTKRKALVGQFIVFFVGSCSFLLRYGDVSGTDNVWHVATMFRNLAQFELSFRT